jgi:hypothetical protein
MQIKQSASNCRWATPTLFVAAPIWYAAEDFPWTCLRGDTPRPLPSTEACATCPQWEEVPAPVNDEVPDAPTFTD